MSEAGMRTSLGRLTWQWVERILLGAALTVALAYAVDFGIFAARGRPVDRVIVTRSLAVPLKGNKTEYDFEGSDTVMCSRSLFPLSGYTPCWYLKRHTSMTDNL